MFKFITIIMLLIINLHAYDNYKIKTNLTSLIIGTVNLKAEVRLLDNISIEPSVTLIPYGENFDILTGLNAYFYFDKVMDSKGYYLSVGASKGVRHGAEFYNYTMGHQWYFNATGIRYLSLGCGVIYKNKTPDENGYMLPGIYFNVGF